MGLLNTVKESLSYIVKEVFAEKSLDEQAKRIEDEIKIAELKNKLRKAKGE